VVLSLYEDSPVKEGWLSLLSQPVYGMQHRLTSRDMVDMTDGVSTIDVWTGGKDGKSGPVRTKTSIGSSLARRPRTSPLRKTNGWAVY